MKVLWLVTGYPSPERPNIGVFHQTMVQALVRQGLDITVLVPSALLSRRRKGLVSKPSADDKIVRTEKVFRPRYLAIPRQNTLGIRHWLINAALSGFNFREYDVVHAHFGYPMGLVGAAIKTREQIPCVLTLHGSDVNVHPELSWYHLRQFRDAISGMDEVLAVSEALAQRTRQLTDIEPAVLRIGIDIGRFQSTLSKQEARRRLGLPGNSFLILYVGNFLKAKGINELLGALSRYKGNDVRGVFVGSGPLEKEIREAENTILLQAVDNSQVPTIMSATDVLVLPSYREGLPTVLVEAGAIGLPVIATKVGGIPEFIVEGTGLLIKPGCDEKLFKALETVRFGYDDALERATRLKDLVAHEYDVDMNAKKLVDVYESVR